ncbi:MAG: hypothetical protein A2Z83_03175 [Omnitrophica bacterium GWA2_52_8]|nr:MAG: hypothetical protein A2Z83_03175 [Omnitrophica bacterium GWA2_52_8]
MTPREIRKLRKDEKITLIEVAAMSGIPSEHIRKIEEGEVVPLAADLKRIEKALRLICEDKRRGEEGDQSILAEL